MVSRNSVFGWIDRTQHSFLLLTTFAALVGQGVGYGNFYLYHLFILISPIWLFRAHYLAEIKKLYPLIILLLYSVVLNVFGIGNWKYSVILLFGLFSVFIGRVLWNISTKKLVQVIQTILFINLGVASLEMLSSFRYPFSRYSKFTSLLGREPYLTDETYAGWLKYFSTDYLDSIPTGLFWNENDLCVFLVIFLPFMFLLKKQWLKLVVVALSGVVLIAASSRICFFIYVLQMTFYAIYAWGKFKYYLLLLIVPLAGICGGFGMTDSVKLREVSVPQVAQFFGIEKGKESSGGKRILLLKEGVDAAHGSWLVGLGPGGIDAHLENIGGVSESRIQRLHFFWLEMVINYGVFFGGGVLVWLLFLGISWVKKRKELVLENPETAVLVAFLSAAPALVVLSSGIYYLPFFLLLGMVTSTSQSC